MKYPKTMASAGRTNLVFAVEDNIKTLDKEDYEKVSPISQHKSWSTVGFNFSDSSKNEGGDGSIEVNHIADMKIRTNMAMQKIMAAESSGSKHTPDILDNRVSFLPSDMKDGKGLSIRQLMENYSAAQLEAASKNLFAQAEKGGNNYAKQNEEQAKGLHIAAIVKTARETFVEDKSVADIYAGDLANAAKVTEQVHKTNPSSAEDNILMACFGLMKTDKSLQSVFIKNDTVSAEKLIIYKPVLKTPNTKKVDSEGYTKAYELGVFCNPSVEYPFHVELTTMKGKPIKDKAVGIQAGTIINRQNFKIDLLSWEWNNIIDSMDWKKKLAELFNYKDAYNAMTIMDEENRKNASKAN